MAGTAQADGIGLPVMTIHPAASTSYPKELVNGDFQTFGNRIVDKRSGGWQYLSFVDGNGMAMEGSSERPWAKVDGWDAVKFGWKSNDSVSGHRGIVEVQRFRTAVKGSTGNVWGEIAAATQGKYLYQDIDTANTSDAMYTIRLKHASRNKDARDSMQVLVGAPGREKPVTMRRTIANAGDKAGEESTTITSTGTGQDDQWDTYEGTVLVPRGQDVTRFTFKSVADSNSAGRPDSAEGNLIDDVVFTKAYQLTYDANGGVKTRTSQIDYTTGGETRGKVKTVRDSPAPPAGQEKIVNGDFEYSGTGAGLSDSPFNYVSLSQKSYYYKDSRNVNHRVALPAGFDAKRFAWKSDQTGKDLGNPPYEQAGDVQVWNRYDGSNHYAELTAAQAGSAIYQDIDTESDSDVQYIVSLRHASLNASHLDSMQVLIGAPGHETPVTMTRVTANGYGDKVGESSDTIATRVSNPKPADREDSDHTGQWETYTGTVTVPAGRPVTRFTFRNVSSKSAWNGNLIDDIAFTKARRLDYDANGGTKAQASQIGYRTDATQGAVETVASKTLPTELVNGSFDYLLDGGWDTISPVGRGGYADDRGWGRFTSVDPASGEYIQNAGQNPATFDSTGKWVKWPGFDAAKFGWASDQKGGQPQGGVGLTDRPNAVELQQDSVTGNTYAEIVGSERGKAILQKIDTQHDSDTVYTVRFDHASLSKEHADSMQVLVNGKPVTMTRVTSNKAGDEQGWTGTSITTHATNTNRFQHDGQWATYEGKVTIPANTPVSTFTFKALNAVDPTKGNLIDNLTFKIAYRLSYDANGGTKKQASRISSMTEAKSKTNGSVRLAADDDVAEYAANGLPDHLVNGTFDYRGNEIINENQRVYGSHDTTYLAMISAKTGIIGNPLHSKLDNWNSGKFGWKSNDATAGVDTVEVQRRNHTPYPTYAGNVWGEIAAAKRGKYIYQDIATTPGVMYKWSLKHASRNADQDDSMQVMIGEPGKTVAQQATRTTSNGSDKTGRIGTTITTHGTAQDGKWETYTGTYIATSTVTRFTFRSVRDSNGQGLDFTAEGNCVDDLSFDKAYRLSYDKNATDANGSVPSDTTEGVTKQAKARTMGTVKTVADENVRYGSLANGDFSYPSFSDIQENEQGTYADLRTFLKSDDGTLWDNMSVTDLSKYGKIGQIPGFDSSRFAWSSTENGSRVELQQDRNTKNTYAEIVAQQDNTSIYQNVSTGNGGVLYKIRLKHASRQSSHADRMQVLVGSDTDHATPVEMTRVTSNGHGDKVGGKSTIITTKVSNTDPRDHGSQWETYEGYYQVPEGQKNTVFMFKSLEGFKDVETLPGNNVGNLVDDIEFSRSYKLTYDKNASDATGKVPSNQRGKENTVQPAKSKTTGSVGLAADKTASGLTVHDLKKNDKGKVPSSSKADSMQPAAFKAPDAKVETIASRAAGDELAVNGGFDVPKWSIAKEGQGLPWIYVYADKGVVSSYYQYANGQNGTKMPGLTTSSFAWRDVDAIGGHQAMELHREKDGNTAADVHAGRTVAQTVATTPGAAYTFSIRHSGRSKGNAGGVTLLAGPDKDHLTPVKLTRTTVSKTGAKYGDKTGDVGTVAYTHSDSADATEGSHDPWDHSDDWESYEGTVIIPAGQSRTMIAYRGVAKDGKLTASANDSIIDDLSFRLAYKLSYDANGGTKKSTSQIGSKTDGTVKAIANTSDSLPAELVNGSFDYPAGLIAGASTKYPWDDWTVVDPINGRYARHIGVDKDLWAPITGWDASKFAWKSTQTKGTNWQQIAQGVELQKDSKTGNQYAELVAGQAGTALYQDIATIPGVSYRWELKHASLDRTHLDGMSVMIGEPGKESAQDATRTTVNGNGDQPGDVGKVISTKVRNKAELGGSSNHSSRNHDGQWETYTGTYIATGTVTRFTFKSVSSSNNVNGNILDDLSFTKAYRLGYDANGGKGQVPSRTEVGKTETAASKTNGTVRPAADKNTGPESGTIADDRRVLTDTTARQDDGTKQRTITRSDGSVRVETIATTGAVSGCQVYYPAGTRITLATAKADSDCWDSSQIGKTNRTFYGWSANTDANDRDVPVADTMDRNTLNANARTEIVMPARAKTVYALWAINPTLSYNVNTPAGSNAPGTPASQTVPYNTAAADKSGWAAGDTGKIPGYRFDGWYTAPNGGNKYDFNTPLTNNVTVYAHWIGNGYTVRFTGNGATGGNTPDQAFQYNIGQNLHRNGFTRDGYTFTGWKRADNQQAYGDGQWVTNLTTQPNGIVTMVAQWSANEAHIRYNPNPPAGKTTGGQGTPNWDGHTGDTPTIGQNGWTIDGYTFAGWATSPDGSGARYAPGARWTANGTLTLYAQWTPGQAGLTYDGNGATGGKTDPQTGKTDEKINVRDNGFTRDGYTFVTWNTQADCKGNAVKPNSEWTLRGSSTLYACWAGNAQTLTYHGNGATGGNTAAQSGKTGDELTTNANGFTRDGYTFVRWDTAKDGSGTAYGEGKNGVSQYVMKPAGNDLYAIWKANPATIQYRNDWPNTTGSTPDTTGNTGDTVTISQNSFDRPGYTFTGWSTSKRGDPSLQPGDKHTLEPRTTTVWAQWKADPAHLVYNSNIGTVGSETKTVDGVVDQTVKTITNPFDRPGYTFSGWNTQADGKGKAYATGADYVLTANDKSTPKNTSVLYAQWKINGASLKFNPNGGIGHVDDVTGDAFSTVTIPGDAKEPKITRPGYRFVGWSTEKNPPAGSTFLQPGEGKVTLPAEGSTTVYAQWEPSLTTLPFTGGQAQVPTIWLYAGFALMLIALGVMMPMLRTRMAATKRTGKHMPITGGKHAK